MNLMIINKTAIDNQEFKLLSTMLKEEGINVEEIDMSKQSNSKGDIVSYIAIAGLSLKAIDTFINIIEAYNKHFSRELTFIYQGQTIKFSHLSRSEIKKILTNLLSVENQSDIKFISTK